MKTIDCRGQSCPAPVIATKKALEDSAGAVCVLLDDGAPRENVTRFAHTRGYTVTEAPDADGWSLIISGNPLVQTQDNTPQPLKNSEVKILLITSDRLGNGSDELGALLMKNFIFTLLETEQKPARILLLNSGVLLAVKGAETVEALNRLSRDGVEVFSCGVCLDYYGKKEQLEAGVTTNMYSTVEQLLSSSVVRL